MASAGNPTLDRPRLAQLQLTRLRRLLHETLAANQFYNQKWRDADTNPEDIQSLDQFSRLPLTTKEELLADQERHPSYGSALTFPLYRYTRLHQTSGTTTGPLRWLDTPESWNWILSCWDHIYDMVDLRPDDRLFFAFSFGPFLGFWSAFEAAIRRGRMCLPGGGMSSIARLGFMRDHKVTVVLCTPTYALRLDEVARAEGIDLAASPTRALIVAGEPGGSIPATRRRIESAWGARLFDHYGLTEVGPVSIECVENPQGLHILESEYIAEVLDPHTGAPVSPGQTGELVLTNLGREGSPVIRYRTGDIVCVDPDPCPCGRPFLRLKGGILGRSDDMIHLRGNNLYPSAIEGVIRRFPEVEEYRIAVDETGPLAELRIELEVREGADSLPAQVARTIKDELLFRAEVVAVPPGSLPRFEMKARRVYRQGGEQKV
jgi:phenylacetate-CoA ligase